MYFAVQEQVEKRSYNSKTRGLYAYDYDTEKVSLVSDEDISEYCMIGDKNIFAYYVVGQGLYYSDINEQTTQLGIKADKITYTKNGKSADNEIDAISSATITTKAVTGGVNGALAVYHKLGGALSE